MAPATRYLICQLDGALYGINLMAVQEVLRSFTLAQDTKKAHVVGTISLRGTTVEVFDLRTRLGLTPAQLSAKSRIVLINERGAFLVDEVVAAVDLTAPVLQYEGRAVTLLDIKALS